ncbi:hypothetical protein D1AOALGA4SA_5493 [Olavius algarvensis Delta 1 endosymbiont]|nr:hypothetical protein D1AOALGA4SA_5493 [Olavius algarvensis Delta 1 endosymbiont]
MESLRSIFFIENFDNSPATNLIPYPIAEAMAPGGYFCLC